MKLSRRSFGRTLMATLGIVISGQAISKVSEVAKQTQTLSNSKVKSAYELWLEEGHVGTKEDFFESGRSPKEYYGCPHELTKQQL